MRIAIVLAGALFVLACQKTADTSDEAPLGATPVAPEDTAGEPEAAEATDPATGADNNGDSTADSDPPSEQATEKARLVAAVKGLTQLKNVEATETGVKLYFVLEQAVTIDESSKPGAAGDALRFAVFYTASQLYPRLAELDGLEQIFLHRKKAIGNVKMTRASFEGLNYGAAMQGVTDKKAQQDVYRKLLKELPKGDVEIDKKYRR